MEPRALRWPGARRVAVGGMAEIWLATEADGRPVAVKRLLPAFSDHPDFVRAFVEEARLLALLDHPNVLRVLDLGIDDEPWLEMEWVDGVDLARVVRALRERGEPAPLGLVAGVARDLLAALEHVHGARDPQGRPLGLVHRDISPANLLVRRDGACTLIDFGVARCSGAPSPIPRAGSLQGKFAYLAPEQLEGHPLDHRVDLYAAGVVLYELATGRHPFLAGSEGATLRAIARGGPASPSSVRPELPERFSRALLRALAVAPAERFAGAGAFAAEVGAALPPALAADAAAALLAGLFPRGLPHELPDLFGEDWAGAPVPDPGARRSGAAPASPLARMRLVRAAVVAAAPGDAQGPEVEILEIEEASSVTSAVEEENRVASAVMEKEKPAASAAVGAEDRVASAVPTAPPPAHLTPSGVPAHRPRRRAGPVLPLPRPGFRPPQPPVLHPAGEGASRPVPEGDAGRGVR